MKSNKYMVLSVLALSICTVPTLVTTLMQFPIWVETSAKATISGIGLLLLIVSAIPILKAVAKYLSSPAIPIVWGILLLLVYLIKSIIDQVFIITAVGTVSNCIGYLVFKVRDRICVADRRRLDD